MLRAESQISSTPYKSTPRISRPPNFQTYDLDPITEPEQYKLKKEITLLVMVVSWSFCYFFYLMLVVKLTK